MIYIVAFALTAITSFIVGLFVLKKNPNSPVNKSWFFLTLAVSFYALFFCFHVTAQSRDIAFFFSKILSIGSILVSPLFFLFALHLTRYYRKMRKYGIASLVMACVFLAMLPGDLIFQDARPNEIYRYFAVPGRAYPIYLVYFAINTILGHIILFRNLKNAPDNQAVKIKYMLFASLIAFIAASSTFFTAYGIKNMDWLSLLLPLYPVIVSIAIVRHQLMDIDVVIRRATVFAGLFTFVYGIFTIFTITGQKLFKDFTGWNEWIATIPTVLIITVFLRPLENILTNATERFLFQKKYDYRELLRTFTNEVLTILDLQKLTEQTIADLTKIIKLESACILLLDNDTKDYKIAASAGIKDKTLVFKNVDIIIAYLKQSHQPLIKDKEAESMEGHSVLREDFKKLNAQLCLPITHHDELLGVLCLGMKKSGEEFTPEDIDILMTLTRTEGIAIANAQLFDQLSKTQAEAAQREKMAVIGTLAAGINHEICNPLGIVRGQCEMFLLNLRDGIYSERSKEELVNISTEIMTKVIRETDRATAITKRLSGFAKPPKKIDSEEVVVEKEADEVMGLVGHDLKLSNIEFRKQFEPGFPTILADRRQIQEVLFNIIRNAAQAMDKKDGTITLSGASANGMAVIKIVDNGSGISKDKIGQIFNPFFTTKEPGKGTGLGLFIVRQVVERNHGTIAVDSEEGVGTTFTLTFPATASVKAMAA